MDRREREEWPCGPTAKREGRGRIGWGLLVALLVLFAGSKSILYDTLDPDSFWHLRVADQLMRQGIGPIVDDLAFTSSKTPWTPYSWLAELGMRAVWSAGGYRAAIAVQAVTIAAMYTLLAMSCVQRGASRLAVVIVLLCAGYLSLPYLSFRPATFALALFALAVWFIVRDRAMGERSRAVWWIVPLTVLMVNVHLFAVLVPASVGALLVGAFVERRQILRYLLMFALCCVACLMTPMLPGMLASMWSYQANDPMVARHLIAELTPFYSGPMGWLSVAIVGAGIAVCVRRRQMLRAGEWVWLVLGLLLLFRMGRFAPLFVLIASPIVAVALPSMDGLMLEKPAIRFALAGLLAVGIARVVVGFPSNAMPLNRWLNRMGPGTPGYPCDAAEFVANRIEPRTGRVLNEFTWGGYLEWRLGPRFQTLMDGRTQLFPPTFWNSTCLATSAEYRRYLSDTPADAAIVPVDRGSLRTAVIALGWQRIYADDRAALYVPAESSAKAD